LKSLETKVLIDVGCGDFTWMKELALDCKYIGIDIVSDVIECNRRSYGAEDRMFRVLDATSAPIPSVSLPDEERRGVQL
jgi:hypothetical protein